VAEGVALTRDEYGVLRVDSEELAVRTAKMREKYERLSKNYDSESYNAKNSSTHVSINLQSLTEGGGRRSMVKKS